jgi:hypothetical protein
MSGLADGMTDEECYAIVSTWLTDKPVHPPRARALMYRKLMDYGRRRVEIAVAIFAELEREGIGGGQPWQQRWRTLAKAQDDRVEAWADAQLGIDPPIPQTVLEELLHQYHRLHWAECNLCDEIEKRWGAVSPLYDTRRDPR